MSADTSSLTLNRLSVYLRCLEHLEHEGVEQISSAALAERFDLSASQIRKDLAQFGDFGIRGVGYDVSLLRRRLVDLFSLDEENPLLILGIGNLGTALARFPGFHRNGFRLVGLFDSDPEKVGRRVAGLEIRPPEEIAPTVSRTDVRLGILAVPAEAAQESYAELVAAGIEAVLNFAPVRLREDPAVPVKNVDLRIHLEELVFRLANGV